MTRSPSGNRTGAPGVSQRRDGSGVAFRDPNGSVGSSRWWGRSRVEFAEPNGSSGLSRRRDGSGVAFRDPNGSAGFSRRCSRSEGKFVGRPVAPFGGCDAEPGPVGAIFGLLATSFDVPAALLGYLAA